MGKKKTRKQLDDLRKITYGGVLAVKGTDLLRHARSPVALGGDISGFVGIGITGAMSEASSVGMDMIYGKKTKKKVKNMGYGTRKRDGSGQGRRANRLRNPACR